MVLFLPQEEVPMRIFTVILLMLCPFAISAAQTYSQLHSNKTVQEQSSMSKTLVKEYYDTILAQNLNGFISLLSDNVIHDINEGATEVGKAAFKKFMEDQFTHGKIDIKDMIILTSPDDKYAMVRYLCAGKYEKTGEGYPPAKGQHWELPVVTYFKFENGKIAHVSVYYNKQAWINQVS